MKTDYLQIGSHKFARNARLVVDTLFHAGGTAHGMFQKKKHGVMFTTLQGEPRAFLVANSSGTQFFVTAFRQADGRTRYMHSISETDKVWLGMAGMSYSEEIGCAMKTWEAASK